MYLRREIEPDGLPLIVDAIKTKDGEVKELRMYIITTDDYGVKRVAEEFPLDLMDFAPRSIVLLQENKEENNEADKEEDNENK
tara:strand:+ start:183 stop:431 length:249 start_codon:yes stop_codon:yes gene_type:complete